MRWNRSRKKRELTMRGLQQVGVDVRVGLLMRSGGCCWYCGDPLTLATVTADHVQPVHAGGRTAIDNLVSCCRPCNTAKGTSSLEVFRRQCGGTLFWGERRTGDVGKESL